MALKINFDSVNNPETPHFVLAKRSGEKIGMLEAQGIVAIDDLNNAQEISFVCNKNIVGDMWDEIRNFRLVWCVEWDAWYEIHVDVEESDKSIKNVSGVHLPQAELSQVMLYNIEINTEDDIARDDYVNPTVLYNASAPEESLLNRILGKANHYQVFHVDSTIANIQRTFTFDNVSIYDALKDIEEEIHCLVIFHHGTDSQGQIIRGFSVYDIESNCLDCGYRGEFTDTCPECGSHDIMPGYGEDTTIFVEAEELAQVIQLTTKVDEVKNCFKLEAGDDLMTATIRNNNPNGSDYIWYIPDEFKQDMSDELKEKLADYDELYHEYQTEHEYTFDNGLVTSYNQLVTKYLSYNDNLESIVSPVVGYSALMQQYYNLIDFNLYLDSELMPSIEIPDTTAAEQIDVLSSENLVSMAAADIQNLSLATADNIVMQRARALVDSRYKVELKDSFLSGSNNAYTWNGKFVVTNYSDDEDTAESAAVTLTIDDTYKEFVKQRVYKLLHEKQKVDYSITGLFNLELSDFKNELKKFCLNSLKIYQDAAQSCIDILIEQDVANEALWARQLDNLYDEVYTPYYDKLIAVQQEMKIREDELRVISQLTDSVINHIRITQEVLNFRVYLGETLWTEFISYRREDTYSNSNYVSDGLNNKELFRQANEFIKVANKELYKSATLQHSITTTLNNLLVMSKFAPLVDHFAVGNWLRIRVDNKAYKLRLIKYTIEYDAIDRLQVEFSDVFKTYDGESDQYSLINRAQQMATSYSYVQRQASQGEKSHEAIEEMQTNGIDVGDYKIRVSTNGFGQQTQTWDSHGLLLRSYNPVVDEYDPRQTKILNSSIIMTDDNWETTKTAIGQFQFDNPLTNKLETAYGVNGEVIVGKLLLGENMALYNSAGSMAFNENGLRITNNVNTVTINPNSSSLFNITHGNDSIFTLDADGNATFAGDIISYGGIFGGWHITHYDLYAQFSTQTTTVVNRPIYDTNGNPIYETTLVYDNNGDPVYETDNNGDIVYETVNIVDADGNPVYAVDGNGDIIYDNIPATITTIVNGVETTEYVYDENGNIVYNMTPRQATERRPVQQTEQTQVVEQVLVTTDNYYDNYTVLSSHGDIALAIGSTATHTVEGETVPDPLFGAIRMYNNGHIYSRGYHLYNSNLPAELIWERERPSGATTYAKLFSSDSNIPGIVCSFRNNASDDYYHSLVFDRSGVYPFIESGASCGIEKRKWYRMYTHNIDIEDSIIIPHVLQMRDDRNRVRNVLKLYHDGTQDYGSNLIVEGRGNTFVGSGESPTAIYNQSYIHGTAENLFLTSDENIYLYVNCNRIANKKGALIDSNMAFHPIEDAVGNLGHSSYRWDNIYLVHSPTVSSDEKIKKNMAPITKAHELIMGIKPYQFMFNAEKSDRVHYGFSSQQFKQVLDDNHIENCGAWTVDVAPGGSVKGYTRETAPEEYKIYGLRYEELIAPIVAVVQELDKRISAIEKAVNGNSVNGKSTNSSKSGVKGNKK